MSLRRLTLALAMGTRSLAAPFLTLRQDVDPATIQSIIDAAGDWPEYVAPDLTRDITEWLAIGDSFAAGISADVPNDQLNYQCSRFKQSYPNQMNESPRFPGFATSRKFVFGACTGAKIDDVKKTQVEVGEPDLSADHPKIGKPQIGTLSISGNDLGFGNIVNACLYRWGFNPGDCNALLRDAHNILDAPGRPFLYKVMEILVHIMHRARGQNANFQLYVTGYIRFWNDTDPQCNDVTWISWPHDKIYLTTTLRSDMNSIVLKLNALLREAVESLSERLPGIYFVDEFESAFNGQRFCEHEADPKYHENPIDGRTWFIPYNSPYSNNPSVNGSEDNSLFHQVIEALVPPVEGKTAEDQVMEAMAAGDGATKFPQLATPEATEQALKELAASDPERYSTFYPVTWIRVMHPKGSGYTAMANAVIDKVRQFSATGAAAAPPPPPPASPSPSPSPAPPPLPTKAMTIMLQQVLFEVGPENNWVFYRNDPGTTADPCPEQNPAQVKEVDTSFDYNIDDPPFPSGEWDVRIYDEDCKFSSDGNGPGKLSCPGNDNIECREHGDRKGGRGKTNECDGQVAISWSYSYHPAVYCEW